MNRFASLAAAAVAAAALAPAAAHAATPKVGTFTQEPAQKGVKSSLLSIGVDTPRTISSIGILWACKGDKQADRNTTLIDFGDPKVKIKGGAFSAKLTGTTGIGDPFDPTAKKGKAKVTISGTFTSAEKVTGSFSASMPGCASGTVKFAAAIP